MMPVSCALFRGGNITGLLIVLFAILLFVGCATVEPWQKGDLASPPMQVEDDGCHRFERNIEVYREGAVGANGGKSGGGCGCT